MEIRSEWSQRNRQKAEREGDRRRMAAAPPGLLASARWQRENPMIKLAGLGAMAARESNKLPSAATRVRKKKTNMEHHLREERREEL